MSTQTLVQGGDTGRWEQAIYAFLAEKERRSGSMRTVAALAPCGPCGPIPGRSTASSAPRENHRTR